MVTLTLWAAMVAGLVGAFALVVHKLGRAEKYREQARQLEEAQNLAAERNEVYDDANRLSPSDVHRELYKRWERNPR